MASLKLVAIFAIVIVSAAAGLVWPFFLHLHLQPIGSSLAMWHMGKGSQYEPEMVYHVSYAKTNFTADMKFLPVQGTNQSLQVQVLPGGGGRPINQTVQIGLVYDYPNVSPEAKPYFDMLDQSVFSMRDYATAPQYLAKGADWGDLYIGANHEKLTVTDVATTPFEFGSANAYELSYRIGANENKFWIVDNLPLPVKGQVYDFNGTLIYTFDLASLKAPSTPGLTS